jgi:hypothetical protein
MKSFTNVITLFLVSFLPAANAAKRMNRMAATNGAKNTKAISPPTNTKTAIAPRILEEGVVFISAYA